jgi:pimeloyl-ACP methyl ester carboxylesterase
MNTRQGLANDRELLPVRMGYADTRAGQVHFRSCGAGPDIVLLHWAPATGRMYQHVLPLLARSGFRGLAFDVPGYGRSHQNCRGWSLQRMATELLEAATSMHTGPMIVVGGHLSASIAIEMMLAAPDRVTAGVLDGVIGLTPDEMKTLMAGFGGLSPRLAADSSHKRFAFDMTCAFLKEWDPDFKLTEDSLPLVYEYMRDYLEMGYTQISAFVHPEPAAASAPRYDALARLALVTQRMLVLTADHDALAPAYPRVLAKAKQAVGHKFAGGHPLFDSARAPEYANVVGAFAKEKRAST